MPSRLLRLPTTGRLLVCTDLQGNLRDFQTMLQVFEQASREEPDTHMIFAGDLVHGPLIPECEWEPWLGDHYQDQSPELFDTLEQAMAQYPGRMHALLGNHEHAHIGGVRTAKFFPDEAAMLETRMGPERTRRFRAFCHRLPLVAASSSGVVVTHAAPAVHLADIAELDVAYTLEPPPKTIDDMCRVPVLGPLLWARSCPPPVARAFIQLLFHKPDGFVVHGHDVVREGFEIEGDGEQLCLSTSFGLFDVHKRYLDIRLDVPWQSAKDLIDGIHLRPLYPNAPAHPVWGRDYV